MTRKEWIEKNLPAYIDDCSDGGVISCPRSYNELVRMDPGILVNWPCKTCHEESPLHMCEKCWNMELNVKEERKKTMTRREFVIENYGKEVVDDLIFCGIHGCPGHYPKLVALDRSCNTICVGQPSCKDNGLTCTECWNTPIPQQPNDEVIDRAVCDCDTCAHQDICRFECPFRGMTKEMYRHCIEETARYNIPELGIQMRPLHCKRYEPSPAIEDLNTAVFHLKAQHLTDELIRKIFDEEPKESK